MNCPNCGAALKETDKFCTSCGEKIIRPTVTEDQKKQLTKSASALSGLGKAARQARLDADYTGARVLSPRAYNAVLIGVLLWGLLVNVVLCAAVGNVYRYIQPLPFLILYLVLAFAGTMIASKSDKPGVSFLGYNMIVVPLGLVISTLVSEYVDASAAWVVRDAFLYTMLISVGMLAATLFFPSLFEKLGGALLGCLGGLLLCEIILLILGVRQQVTDWIAAGVFALYIGYDIYRSQQFVKTVDNAVDCAVDIYLDVANLFIRLLQILARSKKDD